MGRHWDDPCPCGQTLIQSLSLWADTEMIPVPVGRHWDNPCPFGQTLRQPASCLTTHCHTDIPFFVDVLHATHKGFLALHPGPMFGLQTLWSQNAELLSLSPPNNTTLMDFSGLQIPRSLCLTMWHSWISLVCTFTAQMFYNLAGQLSACVIPQVRIKSR